MIKKKSVKKIKLKDFFSSFFQRKNKQPSPDMVFFGLGVLLIIIGLIVLTSASSVIGLEDRGDSYYFLKQQAIQGLPLGLLLGFLTYKLSLDFLKKNSFYIFLTALILLVLVLIPQFGDDRLGASRWLNIFGFSFQPSELAKFAFVIYLSSWFVKQKDKIKSFKETLIPFLIILAVILGLIILEPDMGTMIIFGVIGVAMYFTAGGSLYHIFGLFFMGVAGAWFLIKAAPYRAARLTTFLNPELDPQGIGYHINQALLAIGSGGWLGRGLGRSRQKFLYLPEVYGDSIFAVLAEELGFIATVFILGLFVYFFLRGFEIARQTKDDFARLLVVGIISWWGFQAIVNIGAMVGILPLTGVPLPFFSFGSTALAVNLAAFGLILNISRQNS